jgi:glucosamine--fructose-6-phosphate aminotransferase (isomerizing)
MCGIFGFVSKEPRKASEIIAGLKILEYRGYDSWGVAIKNGIHIAVDKHIGRIGNASTNLGESTLGIGHTRWATHGRVTKENTHPHLDCTEAVALVHNGIVENHEELKKQLLKKGHIFSSQTDTEVIVHLIEEHLKKEPFIQAVISTFQDLKGLNAFVVLNAKTNEIAAAKNGSPLIVGLSHGSYYISSDMSAFPSSVDLYSLPEDKQVVLINKDVFTYDATKRKPIPFKMHEFDKTLHFNDSKGKFDHYLLKEIYEQPHILSSLYELEKNSIKRLAIDIHNAYGTFLLGCGTASYAAMCGEYYLSTIAKKHINFSVGSEFKYLQDFITKKSLIIPVSQSGETIDIVESVKNTKEKGARIVSLVNIPTSTLSRISLYSLLLHAGIEKAVVGTKSFTAMVGILLLVSYTVAGRTQEAVLLLAKASRDIKKILKKENITEIKKLVTTLKSHQNVFLIGRGISYVASLEGALKLKETALIHAEGFAGGELKHGVIALIEKGTPCFVFAPNDETYTEIVSNAQEIKARGGFIIGVGPKKNSVFDVFLKTADLKEATIISQTVYMQLLAYYLALSRGIEDPDKPRNLAKSVTVK